MGAADNYFGARIAGSTGLPQIPDFVRTCQQLSAVCPPSRLVFRQRGYDGAQKDTEGTVLSPSGAGESRGAAREPRGGQASPRWRRILPS